MIKLGLINHLCKLFTDLCVYLVILKAFLNERNKSKVLI